MNQDIFLLYNSTKKSEPIHTKPTNQLFQKDGIGKNEHDHNDNNSTSYNSNQFSPKQTILPTTTLTSDKSSSFILSNRRTLASELAANDDDLSASLITTTRPPSSFNHQSLHSYASHRGGPDVTDKNKVVSNSSSSAYGNDHNIWRINSTNHDDNDENGNNNEDGSDDYNGKYSGTEHHQQGRSAGSDNQSDAGADFILDNPRDTSSHHYDRQRKQQRQFYSGYHNNRPLSPGQYFGARSLPLESMGDLWQQPSYTLEPQKQAFSFRSPSSTMNNLASKKMNSNDRNYTTNQRSSSPATTSYPSGSHISSGMEPLWKNFKALPAQLNHRHRWTSRSQQRNKILSLTPRARSTLSRASASMRNDDGMEGLTEKVQSLRIQDGYTEPGDVQLTQQQQQQRRQPQPQRESRQSFYSLHPHDSITIKCLISSTTIHTHDGHLTLTNNDDSTDIDVDDEHHGKPLLFFLFSANGNVTFDVQSGTVSPGQTIDIWIRPRKRILHRLITTTNNTLNRHTEETVPHFDESVALLVGQDLYRLKVNLDITVEDPEDDDDDDDDEDEDDNDDDQQQQQQVHDGQHKQDKSGDSDNDRLDQTTTSPSQATGQHDDTDKTPATSTLEIQDLIDKTIAPPSTSQIQDQEKRCPFCLLDTLYPSS